MGVYIKACVPAGMCTCIHLYACRIVCKIVSMQVCACRCLVCLHTCTCVQVCVRLWAFPTDVVSSAPGWEELAIAPTGLTCGFCDLPELARVSLHTRAGL